MRVGRVQMDIYFVHVLSRNTKNYYNRFIGDKSVIKQRTNNPSIQNQKGGEYCFFCLFHLGID